MEAQKIGLIDKILHSNSTDELVTAAEDFSLSELPQKSMNHNRVLSKKDILYNDDLNKVLTDAHARLQSKFPGEHAPLVLLDAIKAAVDSNTFIEGESKENLLFEKLRGGSQARALQYIHFAERKVQKLKNRPNYSQYKELLHEKVKDMMKHCAIEAFVMVEEGAELEQIDSVLKRRIGISKGLFDLFELFGLIGSADERNAVLQMVAMKREKEVPLPFIDTECIVRNLYAYYS